MSWSALLIGPLLTLLLFGCWLGVQQLWRRVFELPEQADALAGRERCASCSCPRSSSTVTRTASST